MAWMKELTVGRLKSGSAAEVVEMMLFGDDSRGVLNVHFTL